MGYVEEAIQSVRDSSQSFCKFLSANDSGATGGHQSGILISKSAQRILFSQSVDNETILKRNVKIDWQDGTVSDSCFTYYKSKNEFRITRFGRGFSLLNPNQTGSLFVFTQQDDEYYSGFLLDTEDEIEKFLNTFNISPAETNTLIDKTAVAGNYLEAVEIQKFISSLTADFPLSSEMSSAARKIQDLIYDHNEWIRTDPDRKIIDWTNMEYTLFRAVEHARYGSILAKGFESVDDFVGVANTVLNRRKSRAGKSLEHHLAAIFDGNGIEYASQATTEGKKRPDFLFPSERAYFSLAYPTERLVSLAAKTTCKDRWRQVLNEANRLKDHTKYLCTLQQGISPAQMDEMQEEKVILVVPRPFISTYPHDRQNRIWTLSRFVKYVKEIEMQK